MNQTDCPEGFATDTFFIYNTNNFEKCAVDLKLFMGLSFSLLFFRFTCLIIICLQWKSMRSRSLKREKEKGQYNKASSGLLFRTRFPIIPFLWFFDFVILITIILVDLLFASTASHG